jgi:TorA maturation chaperone TorD
MIAPEEQARANLYGLLARLFYAPPDAALLDAMASQAPLEGDLGPAWHELSRAAAGADPEAVRVEFESAFIGTGKAAVTLYTTAYALRHASEAPLAELRSELARLGLGRRERVHEPEDHIAALCETMRHLVAGQKCDLEGQSRFFSRWIHPAMEPLCNAVERSDKTFFYKHVARFAKGFCTLEHMAFEML